jgi:hypothetical protein
MEDSFDVNINQLRKAFNLNTRQEDLVRVVLKSRNYELEESLLRDKLKAIMPALVPNFQHYVNTLQSLDILSVHYDKDGKRIIGMSPSLNEINLDDSVPLVQGKPIYDEGDDMKSKNTEARKLKLTEDDINNISGRIVDIFKTTPGNKLESSSLLSTIKAEYDISGTQFKKVLDAVKGRKDIVISRNYEGYGKSRKSFLSAAFFSEPHPANIAKKSIKALATPLTLADLVAEREERENKTFDFHLALKKEDMDAVSAILARHKIQGDASSWLSDVVQEAIINLLDGKIGDGDIHLTMSDETRHKLASLAGMYKAEGNNINDAIDSVVAKFIEEEFDHKFIIKQMAEMIAKSSDASVLERILDMATVRLSNLPPTSFSASASASTPISASDPVLL